MREQIKQLLKNSVYRAIGEAANGIGVVNGDGRSLRVLMYHKVNDLPGNRMSMPVSLFDEQMAQLRELGYTVVDLDAVLGHYVDGAALPDGAVLITFDDGYRDNLENAAAAQMILQRGETYRLVQCVDLVGGDEQRLVRQPLAGGVASRKEVELALMTSKSWTGSRPVIDETSTRCTSTFVRSRWLRNR